MGTEIIPFTTEGAWLEARKRDVTSTEVSALFNASPYRTAFDLWHTKHSGDAHVIPDNPRMRWGRRLQDPIAHGVAEDRGLVIHKATEYIRDARYRIGSSFDFRVAAQHTKSEGLMEIKTVDAFAFRDSWRVQDGEVLEAPPHIELQVQHQMLVSGVAWALIVALIGGNRVSVIEREYDPELGAAIIRKVNEFWSLVDAGTPPAPDYTRDAERIASLYLEATAGKTLDARGDDQLAAWTADYQQVGIEISLLGGKRNALRARILERVGDASRVELEHSIITASTIRESIVPQHTRAAHRALRITNRKENAA